ncbi:MAG TPA: hypothetical protein VFZ25_17055, partial [Chloroflexota bacterium]|nr:hypothetical protein [Chloroflexota bacterium]
PPSPDGIYTNAQIGDVGALGRKPPLRVRLRARFSQPAGKFHGTAGFGFWNAALAPGSGLPRPPRAAWFFLGGAEFDVPLVLDVPGNGFKAAVLDAQRPAFFALLPTAPLGFLLLRHPVLYRRLWPLAQRALRAAEQPLGELDITGWHRYDIDWQSNRLCFGVDGRIVLDAPGPGWPLAFVAWIDNAFAVATPRGRFGLGSLTTARRAWLEITDLHFDGP